MYLIVFVTAKNIREANKISKEIIDQKLAACVNSIKDISSCYRWEGKIVKSKEVLLIIKTKNNLFKKLEKAIKSVHSYTVPEIIALPILGGSSDYLKWISSSIKKG